MCITCIKGFTWLRIKTFFISCMFVSNCLSKSINRGEYKNQSDYKNPKYSRAVKLQHSNLTFSKSHLLATFNCKMVAIKKFKCKRKNLKGRIRHDILHKVYCVKPRIFITSLCYSKTLMLSLHIHVEFLNDERGKEKDR